MNNKSISPDSSLKKPFDVAIVGGGFSGVALVYHLFKESHARNCSLNCLLFEPADSIGSGIAYDSRSQVHTLNVPAAKMSIDDSEPDSFCRWLKNRELNFLPIDFVPRRLYQEYLAHHIERIQSIKSSSFALTIIKDSVVSAARTGHALYCLRTDSGREHLAENAAIAIGNSLSKKTVLQQTMPALRSPWDVSAISQSPRYQRVLIIGTGLTAVDTILGLDAAGFRGSYTLISRRGQLPKSHTDRHGSTHMDPAVLASLVSKGSLKEMLSAFRRIVAQGEDWRGLIDSLRPYSSEIWARFSLDDRRLFLERLRPYWDSHRHRVPAANLKKIMALREAGRLDLYRGRIIAAEQTAGGVAVRISGGINHFHAFDACFDCSGLWPDLKASNNPLLSSLIKAGLADLDDLGLGLRTTATGELLTPNKLISPGIFTLGSLRRGELWETTAVREIRLQASCIAKIVSSRLAARKVTAGLKAANC